MNERIKKMMDEANQYAVSKYHELNPGSESTPRVLEIFSEKFAELIVRECVCIGQETSKEIFKMSKKEGDIFEYESHGAERVVDNIKEHFGIE